MPTTPKKKSDSQAYLERRGWEKNPSNNVWRRVERTKVPAKKDEKGDVVEGEKLVEKILEEVLEQEALDLQQGRDIEYLLARVDGGKLSAASLPVNVEIDPKKLSAAIADATKALLDENAKLAARVSALEAALTNPAPAPAPAKPSALFARNAAPSTRPAPAPAAKVEG